MNCYLSWNLKDMTNISAEKLQKNISQQTSYIQLYRSELTKEAYKFNIGSLLRHVCTERSSFGTEPIQRRATDCLIIFLHAAAFQKVTYFAPTDAENPAVAKCARNLHRLMLENVKSTMRFIDYEVLQKHARGEIGEAELFSERERIHNSVFPDESLLPVSDSDEINAEFLKLVEMETRKARSFVDFDVQRNSILETELCQKLAKVPRSETALPESRYGLIGSCRSSLETPFIRYGNSYYSFVTAYSLRTITGTVTSYVQEHPVAVAQELEEPVEEEAPVEAVETEEPEATPEVAEPVEVIEPVEVEPEPEEILEEVIPEEPVEQESETEAEPEAEEIEVEPEQEAVIEEETVEEEAADEEPVPEESPEEEVPEESIEQESEPEAEEIEVEPEQEEITEEEPAVEEETAEEEIPEPVAAEEEDIPFDEPTETYEEPEMSEASDEEEDDEEEEEAPVQEPVIEQMASDEDDKEETEQQEDPFSEDDDDEEETYNALISPDAYDYLNDSKQEDFNHDPMLDEQEYDNWYDDDDDDEELPKEDDEPDPYSGESLFSIMDDSDEGEMPEEEPEQEAPADNLIQKDSFPTDEDEEEEDSPAEMPEPPRAVEEPEPEPEPEPQEEEPEIEAEPEPEPELVEEKPVEQPLPLLDQILSFAPSKSNPIVQYLSSCQYEQKKELVRFIELARKAWLIDGKDKVFSIPDTSISVAVFAQTQDPMLSIQRRENIGAVMYASQKDSWNSLELSYDGSGQLAKADYIRISRNSYSDWEWKIVEKLGNRLMERRGK